MFNIKNNQKFSNTGMIITGVLIIGFPVFVLNHCSTMMNNISF